MRKAGQVGPSASSTAGETLERRAAFVWKLRISELGATPSSGGGGISLAAKAGGADLMC